MAEQFDDQISSEEIASKFHSFLVKHFYSQELFSKEQLKEAVECNKESTYNTYFSKKVNHFLKKFDASNNYRVKLSFKKYIELNSFLKYFSQTTNTDSGYIRRAHTSLIIFDFYLPLSNETELKEELNWLFYRDTLELRLKHIGIENLTRKIPKINPETDTDYYNRLIGIISNMFIGYSINSVQGRFRMGELRAIDDLTDLNHNFQQYLIDETTAIVRFIIPIGDGLIERDYFVEQENEEPTDYLNDKADLIRKLFRMIFVEAILEMVDGEAEIWVLESGLRTKLHRFCT